MEFYLQKAKLFALETAKKSQEIANQAAKLSQELATETAKRSKELAIDVTKKADQLKAYAGELTPGIAAKGSGAPVLPSEEELEEFGITPGLRDFVKGLTIKTFRDFPVEADDGGFRMEPGTGQDENQGGKKVLSPWQEKHGVLVLLTVKEISDFRYVLCPRRMTEARFWRIYFTLVNSQIKGYEARAMEKAATLARAEENKRLAQAHKASEGHGSEDLGVLPALTVGQAKEIKRTKEVTGAVALRDADHELDAYLMGTLDSDDGADEDDDDGFDVDFDRLVNSTADSDGEDEASHVNSNNESKKQSIISPPAKPVAGSEGSSDGELVEIPDNDSEQASRVAVGR